MSGLWVLWWGGGLLVWDFPNNYVVSIPRGTISVKYSLYSSRDGTVQWAHYYRPDEDSLHECPNIVFRGIIIAIVAPTTSTTTTTTTTTMTISLAGNTRDITGICV